MKLCKVAHHLFFFVMFLICAIAVTAFAYSKVNASISLNASATPSVATSTDQISNTSSVSDLQPKVADTTQVTTTTKNTTTITPEDSARAAAKTAELILSGGAGVSSSNPKTQTATRQAEETQDNQALQKDTSVTNDSPAPVEAQIESTVQGQDNNLEAAASRVQLFSAPTVLQATDLAREKNPKFAGGITSDISVENVKSVVKYDGQKTFLFEGKSTPNNFFNIFIFSTDPIVMTVKSDESGNWSYELNKDLKDGQHEVYVAMTEKDGRIVSKGQPLAFIKTAEAVTIIPVSQLDEKKSPMQKNTAKYIMVAIIIMSVCLAAALVLIGILNYKYKTDETTF